MAATRKLPDIKEIEKILKAYLSTLTSQFKLKKLAVLFINKVRSFVDSSNNVYLQNDQELVKKETIEGFLEKFRKALALENPVPKLIQLIEELDDEYKSAADTQYINFSKYRISLKAVICYVISIIKDYVEFHDYLRPMKEELDRINTRLNEAHREGFDKEADAKLINRRNELAIKLTNLQDIPTTKAAVNEYNLFQGLEKPHKSFKPITKYDKELSNPVEIHYDIPWILQPLLHVVYFYRIDRHDFPPNAEEWKAYLKTAVHEEKIESKSDKGASDSHSASMDAKDGNISGNKKGKKKRKDSTSQVAAKLTELKTTPSTTQPGLKPTPPLTPPPPHNGDERKAIPIGPPKKKTDTVSDEAKEAINMPMTSFLKALI